MSPASNGGKSPGAMEHGPTCNGPARPRLLDLFCGAGGAAMGYHRAGFEVVGVDIKNQPNYPFPFIRADALEFMRNLPTTMELHAIHSSPPCQAHIKGLGAVNRALGRSNAHLDLIAQTRELLQATGLPYVIENVVGAPLRNPVQLCGSSFNLAVRRHRRFETNWPLLVPPCEASKRSTALCPVCRRSVLEHAKDCALMRSSITQEGC